MPLSPRPRANRRERSVSSTQKRASVASRALRARHLVRLADGGRCWHIENVGTHEQGTIFKPDNTTQFINRWLGVNR